MTLQASKRNRIARMAAEIAEAEEALANPTTPDNVKHFYIGQLSDWKEEYAKALESLEKDEAQLAQG